MILEESISYQFELRGYSLSTPQRKKISKGETLTSFISHWGLQELTLPSGNNIVPAKKAKHMKSNFQIIKCILVNNHSPANTLANSNETQVTKH